MMIFGHELGIAENEGVPPAEQGDRAGDVSDAVLDRIGRDHFIETMIAVDFEMNTSDKDAVLNRAFEESGYERVRAELF